MSTYVDTLTVKVNYARAAMVTMAPRGFVTITIREDQHKRLKRMKRAKRLGSITECIDELLKFCVY